MCGKSVSTENLVILLLRQYRMIGRLWDSEGIHWVRWLGTIYFHDYLSPRSFSIETSSILNSEHDFKGIWGTSCQNLQISLWMLLDLAEKKHTSWLVGVPQTQNPGNVVAKMGHLNAFLGGGLPCSKHVLYMIWFWLLIWMRGAVYRIWLHSQQALSFRFSILWTHTPATVYFSDCLHGKRYFTVLENSLPLSFQKASVNRSGTFQRQGATTTCQYQGFSHIAGPSGCWPNLSDRKQARKDWR